MGVRITFLIAFFSFLYGALVFQLYSLQIQKGKQYQAKAFASHRQSGILDPVRGSIYFTNRDGGLVPAAINKEYPMVYASPDKIKDIDGTAQILSEISTRDKQELTELLSKKNDLFESIIKRATDDQLQEISRYKSSKNDFKDGVNVRYDRSRFYPLGTVASHLLGFVSADEKVSGASGIELYYGNELKGTSGESEGDRITRSAEDGKNLKLTIDLDIQREAERVLDDLVTKYKAQGGTVIVEDPKTGKILAMGSIPAFDPNSYSEFDIGTFLNPALQAVYEPGSIFKVITMASALDAGKITPDTTYIDSGSLTLNGKTIKNWDLKAHGKISMTQVIEGSINTGAAFAEKTLGHGLFYNYLINFGLKDKTGVDLPGEVSGSLKPLEVDKRDVNFATASFGQGISVTPVNLLRAMSAIANKGVMMKPYLNAEKNPEVVGRVISEQASRNTVNMMVSAVNKAEIAKVKSYNVAGKTGTAQIPDFKKGGYTNEVINTYVGFAPAYDPEFVILIKLDKPEGAPLAGLTVVPAFRNLAQFILNHYNVPPDDLINNQ